MVARELLLCGCLSGSGGCYGVDMRLFRYSGRC